MKDETIKSIKDAALFILMGFVIGGLSYMIYDIIF